MNNKLFITTLWILATCFSGLGQGLTTDGTKIINAAGEPVILRGMGFGGWMLMEGYMMQSSEVADTQHEFKNRLIDLMGEEYTSNFFDAWHANHVTKADIDSLASWGYNSCRLPMHYNLFTLPIEEEPIPGENTWLNKGFDMVDSLLQWCASNQIYLILDLHAAPGGQGYNASISDYDPTKPSLWESAENRAKTVALWARLAERYSNEPWMGGYDLLNEVNWNLPGNVMLRQLYIDITEAIRATDTMHILFIEGNWFANDFTGLTPPWDDNMVYSFHKYWNFNDQASIDWVLDIRDQYNVPLWMGEGGENSNVWFCDAIKILEENDIGWAFWPMKRIQTIVGQYSIPFTEGYKAILDYWKGLAPQPTVAQAYNAMMELAVNANSQHCLYRKDVHDAQIRQVHSDETIPYRHQTIPGVIYLTDYDLGRIEMAYSDVDFVNYSQSVGFFTAWNSGWHYRNDGVDIEPNTDTVNSNGYHVGFVQKDEWLNYTVDIAATAVYKAKVRVAAQSSNGSFHLALNGEDVTVTKAVSATGGWTNFTTAEISDVVLFEGQHTLTMWFDNSIPFNVSSVEFIETGSVNDIEVMAVNGHTGPNEKSILLSINQTLNTETINGSTEYFNVVVNGQPRAVSSVVAPNQMERTVLLNFEDYFIHSDEIKVSYSGSVITSQTGKPLNVFSDLTIRNILPLRAVLPQKIQAEDFVNMAGLGLEETTDIGGGLNIGYTNPGDFADYLIYAPDDNIYQVNIRVAAKNAVGSFGFYLVDENQVETELCIVQTPVTGGWQTWQTIDAFVSIPAGAHTLRMKVISQEFNLNWFDFVVVSKVDEAAGNPAFSPRLFPNPVGGPAILIEHGLVGGQLIRVDVLDSFGKMISTENFLTSQAWLTLNVAHLRQGVYILRLQTGAETRSLKIIKQ